ncbi:Gfo/Idh/MocA family oxidoreductase [Paenibacillus filicis]|uniref:Gfo/Idh/MocA family oxidoreductase n=1 Tax=Paenibacillus gyeongsangnamensis TaxID=3388067 RepID=A0ABT4QJ92_9BACL|nr:Gfo/Idh/MocA family oxidoreductase [Paenibacillus filicis]MCZ8516946.1 Gfo/Idh/MocA family oxidoreductase [Paenibacillus filicis]
MEPFRLIQIGTGGFGQSWLQIVKEHAGVELAAVVDITEANLQEAGEKVGLPPERLFLTPEEALAKVEADMALIVTPPQTHKALALQALEAGLHVLMEKPLTHTYQEALELLEGSRHYAYQVAVSQNYRWRPALQTVRKLLDEQAIGQVGYIEYEFRKAMKFGGWRDRYQDILLEDMSIHHFDIMRFLLGKEPVDINARSFRPAWSWFSGNPSAGASIRFEDDIHVHYFGSWVSWGKETTWNGDIRIVGDRGAIEIIDDAVTLWTGEEPAAAVGREVELVQMPYTDRASSLEDFVASVKAGKTPATAIEDNLRSFELTCAAIASARSGQSVHMEEFRHCSEPATTIKEGSV